MLKPPKAASLGTHRMTGTPLQRRNAKLRRERPYCVICTKEGKKRLFDEVDHVIPLHMGGPDDDSNIQGLCYEHHMQKSLKEARDRSGG
jgi:5-methylcytosine-specific restriction protein A